MSKTRLASKSSLAILSTLFALFLCELLLRVLWPGGNVTDLRGITVPDAEFGYRFSPHSSKVIHGVLNDFSTTVEINSHGFRSPEYEMKSEPGSFRIALLGDSEIFGIGVDEEDMLNMRMEELLNRGTATRHEVLNFAMPGTGTIVQGRILEQIALNWELDAAIFVVTVANDLSDNVNFVNRRRVTEPPERRSNAIWRGIRRLRLYTFAEFKVLPVLPGFLILSGSWFGAAPPSVQTWYMNSDLEGSFALMAEALSRSRDACTRHEVHIYLAALPARSQFVPSVIRMLRNTTERDLLQTIESDWDRPQRMLMSYASDHGIPYIEVIDEFKELAEHGVQLKHPNDGHLNARGTLELARILAKAVQDKQRANLDADRGVATNFRLGEGHK